MEAAFLFSRDAMNERLAPAAPATTACAFRGYNVTNLGRTAELLDVPRYAPTVERRLTEASRVASDLLSRRIDLLARVRRQEETTLETYGDAVALVLAVEAAHVDLLREEFGFDVRQCRTLFGYSLGEIAAHQGAGFLTLEEAMQVPVALANDCAALCEGMELGVLFSRKRPLDFDQVEAACRETMLHGDGLVGISTFLSPNSALLMGQKPTLSQVETLLRQRGAEFVSKVSKSEFPPLHTPVTWAKQIPDRASLMMRKLDFRFSPTPRVLSLATGDYSYREGNAREILRMWVDRPQRLWGGIEKILQDSVDVILHIGPEPNLVPATFRRLCDNVEQQLKRSLGLRTVHSMITRPWLKSVLPAKAMLLRAPLIRHVILEDWLLEQVVSPLPPFREDPSADGLASESASA